ncbi:MAG TPA: hypothetical protein VMZ92_05560 [Planctomycetota bacterium]|nr:hypothetical protein [Planctomycetota bacterium]
MDRETLTVLIGLTPFLLAALGYGTGWVLFRKRDRKVLRYFRVVLVVGWLFSFQLLACHAVFMVGFDRGTSGQPRQDAYFGFYRFIPYIGSDGITLYRSPFGALLLLLGSNAAVLWLLRGERREADTRLAAAQPPPTAEGS